MLLFDENISYKIVKKIQEQFPGSKHVNDVTPVLKGDLSIFKYAKQNQFIIVTRDDDFQDLQTIHGFPPKIVWLRTGNTSTLNILHKMILKKDEIKELINSKEIGILEIY